MTWITLLILLFGLGCVGVYAMQEDKEYQHPGLEEDDYEGF